MINKKTGTVQVKTSRKKNKYVTPIAGGNKPESAETDQEVVSGKVFNSVAQNIDGFQKLINDFNREQQEKETREAEKRKADAAAKGEDRGNAVAIPDLLNDFDKKAFMDRFAQQRKKSRDLILELFADGLAISSSISDAAEILRHTVSDKIVVDTDGMTTYLTKTLDTKFVELLLAELDISEEGKAEVRAQVIERIWARELPKPSTHVRVEGVQVSVDATNGKTKTRTGRTATKDGDTPSERNANSPIAVSSGRGPYGLG